MGELNRRYFEALMADRHMSMRGLAAQMGIGHSQLSLTFSGSRRLQLDEAAQLSDIFGVPIQEVVANAGAQVRASGGRRVPVVGVMRGDGTVALHGDEHPERVVAPGDLPDDAIAIQCRTAGSPLEWLDRAVFFCRDHGGLDPALLGRLCYVKLKDGPVAIATLRLGYRDGTYSLIGPHPCDSVALEWATPIALTKH